MGAVYFVVLRRAGVEASAIYYDNLPAWMTGKRAAEGGLVYALRLDTLPDADRWTTMSRADLERHYRTLKAAGKLPGSNLVPPRKQAPPRLRIIGDWWTPPPPTWDPRAPGQPFPVPGTIKRRYTKKSGSRRKAEPEGSNP
jgi:hypothetical protein